MILRCMHNTRFYLSVHHMIDIGLFLLATVTSAVLNSHVCVFSKHMFSSLLGKYLGAEEPGHRSGRDLTLLGSTNMFSMLLYFTLQPAVNEFQLLCMPVIKEDCKERVLFLLFASAVSSAS